MRAGPVCGGGQRAEQITPVHRLTGRHGGVDRLICRAQGAVLHADNAATGHPAGERDDAVTGGDDRFTRAGREVDPAMSGQPPQRRGQESP